MRIRDNKLASAKLSTTTKDRFAEIRPVNMKKPTTLNRPVLIAGFPDTGLVGSITINHIIQQLDMHQIAFIQSLYIMPAGIFIGKKFRHPFRIYANKSGTICALIGEVPVVPHGIHHLVDAIIEWGTSSNIDQVIVVGGMPPSHFDLPPSYERKPFVLVNSDDEGQTLQDDKSKQIQDFGQAIEATTPDFAFIPGLPGALLSLCASRGITCTGLMVPPFGTTPDPEGAAILLETLSKIVPTITVDSAVLRQQAEIMKRQLQEILKAYSHSVGEYPGVTRSISDTERIYK